MPEAEVVQHFGHKVRLRVCGICLTGEKILLANHRGVGPAETFWIPPGGGVHFGESAEEALKREFLEETGLEVRVGEFLFVNEFIGPPLHAVELFFRVYPEGGHLRNGSDPEMVTQIITGVAYLDFPFIRRLQPFEVHNLFRHCRDVSDLLGMRGYYQFKPETNDRVP